MASVSFDHVWRRFGPHTAVADLCLDIADGDFLVLLGASGCGKTTSLRMLAGLDEPSEGEIRIDGRVVNKVPPGERDVAMVFQSYALFPHMTVEGNLTFGPRMRRENKAATRARIAEVAQTLELTPLLGRRPAELSGGQRQRVALGRALLREPKLFLMDEPLSNLDAALRGQMRAEIVSLHRRLGITTAYVTHDQVEAMTMATRIAIMFEGRLHQAGKPAAIFDDPASLRVATFIGAPQMNIVDGQVLQADGVTMLACLGTTCRPAEGLVLRAPAGSPVRIGIRPGDIAFSPPHPGAAGFSGAVEFLEPMGSETFATMRCGRETVVVRAPGRTPLRLGERVTLYLDGRFTYAFDAEDGRALIDRSRFGLADLAARRLPA
ncbi:ABC transporter ATP-binding protein [Acidisoma cellulosilytica]|uniref:ABC transporter ATP-binding protein n=1 Tax=Acidisoma cellulosilyticum TaxID=2802395 RepID=A0A964E6D0_9PROT|nr:ABC transporter ATP-binding protein [Acidisoma cellulosilyticum]MCB8883590.1 ABC transporter ATP-binding protein [Acidisoma cellulosilyticum]